MLEFSTHERSLLRSRAMLTRLIWASGTLLQVLLLLRGVQTKWIRRFPLFYSYNLFVFLEGLVLAILYGWFPRRYAPVYWICEFVAVVLGSLVLFEVYRVALRPYPGTARMARNLLCFVFALAFAKVIAGQLYGGRSWSVSDVVEIERNLRTVQGIAILALIIVTVVYAIPRGRHLKGILLGYGLFLANSIVQLSLLSYLGGSFQRTIEYIQPFAYDIVLCIWTVALWRPEREAATSFGDQDHPALVSRSRRDLDGIRVGLMGVSRR